MQKAYSRLVDWHADNAYASHLDRIGHIRAQDAAQQKVTLEEVPE